MPHRQVDHRERQCEGLQASSSEHARTLEDGGTVFVEYLVVASLVTIGSAAAVIAVGVPFANMARFTFAFLALPVP